MTDKKTFTKAAEVVATEKVPNPDADSVSYRPYPDGTTCCATTEPNRKSRYMTAQQNPKKQKKLNGSTF